MDKARGGRDPERGGRRGAAKTARAGGTRATAPPADLDCARRTTGCDRGRRARDRRRPVSGQGGGRRAGDRRGRHLLATATTRSTPRSSGGGTGETDWREAPMAFVDNDRWRGVFVPERTPATSTRSSPGATASRAGATRSARSTRPASTSRVELIEGRNLVEAAVAGERASAADRKALKALVADGRRDRRPSWRASRR